MESGANHAVGGTPVDRENIREFDFPFAVKAADHPIKSAPDDTRARPFTGNPVLREVGFHIM